MSRPVIITCALTGDSDTPGRSPHVPVTPKAIADDAIAAARAGAAIAHIHVRDPETGKGSRSTALYREVMARISESGVDVIVNLTAGMGGKVIFGSPQPVPLDPSSDIIGAVERMVHIEALRPDICSLDCGSFNYGMSDEIYVSTTAMVRSMAERIRDLGVKPELEVFDTGQLRLAASLVAEGLVVRPAFFQFALGLRWGAPSDAATMLLMRNMLPVGSVWVAFGAGAEQMPVAAQSVLLGGHVRVGLEDNLYRSRGVLATNRDLVEDAVRLIETLGHRQATPAEARDLLQLAPGEARSAVRLTARNLKAAMSILKAVQPLGQSYEPVYASLKHALMCGDMDPGERLVVAHLAEKFGTSAMPIRQALQRLVADGALVERPHRGVEVPRLDVADLMDLRRVRCALEGQATEWAAQTITRRELDHLRTLQDRMLATKDLDHAENYLAWNLEFHFTVYAAARSPSLIPLIENLWLRAGPCLTVMRSETTLGLGLEHHDEVLDALAKGDGGAARDAVERELSEAAEIIARSMEPSEPLRDLRATGAGREKVRG